MNAQRNNINSPFGYVVVVVTFKDLFFLKERRRPDATEHASTTKNEKRRRLRITFSFLHTCHLEIGEILTGKSCAGAYSKRKGNFFSVNGTRAKENEGYL